MKEKLDYFPNSIEISIIDAYGIILPTVEDLENVGEQIMKETDWYKTPISYTYAVQIADPDIVSKNDPDGEIEDDFAFAINEYVIKTYGKTRDEMYAIYGSLFFLGILLSIVFLFATALIIYYKQISEGYDDRHRFQILLKVGMTANETKATIRRQIVIVFLLPVITASTPLTSLAASFWP